MSPGLNPSSPTFAGPSTNAAVNGSSTPHQSVSPGTQTSYLAGGGSPQQSSGIQTVSSPASFKFMVSDPLYTVQHVNDSSWPDDFPLDRGPAKYTLGADRDFYAPITVCGEPHASVNWDQHTKLVDLNQVPATPMRLSASRALSRP